MSLITGARTVTELRPRRLITHQDNQDYVFQQQDSYEVFNKVNCIGSASSPSCGFTHNQTVAD